MRDSNLRSMVRLALVASLVLVATMFLKITTPTGYVHLGDGVIYGAALAFGPSFAAASGSVGSALADILTGYAMWAPWTFVIKGVAGWAIGRIGYNQGRGRQLLGMVVAAVWTVFGYAVGTAVMYNPQAAIAESLGNVVQVGSGVVIGLFLGPVLKSIANGR